MKRLPEAGVCCALSLILMVLSLTKGWIIPSIIASCAYFASMIWFVYAASALVNAVIQLKNRTKREHHDDNTLRSMFVLQDEPEPKAQRTIRIKTVHRKADGTREVLRDEKRAV